MPHFIIHCSKSIFASISPDELMQQVYNASDATGLFKQGDIKVRIQSFEHYNIGNTKDEFIHLFGNIMKGRTDEQKMDLSKRIIAKLKAEFPNIPIISINIRDFEKASYCNTSMA
jgi:5-carboxymethyl-2-hydroxymuconate isomerase